MNITININGDIFFEGTKPYTSRYEEFFPFEDEFSFIDDDPYSIPEFLTIEKEPATVTEDKNPVGTGVGNIMWFLN